MRRTALIASALALIGGAAIANPWENREPGAVRVATFNVDMARKGAGVLLKELEAPGDQIRNVAEIIWHVRPDILLLNEIDYDPTGAAVLSFARFLAQGAANHEGLLYLHRFAGPVNTGVPSGLDLDGDGKIMGARDALGFGRFPGQYGMAVLSRYPILLTRTFQNLKWADIPWAEAPKTKDGTPYYSTEAWAKLPVSSKSHWDVMVQTPQGAVHILASHPTPPVFDGPEDRNGLRNAAEIRFWADYIDGAAWIADDTGQAGGLSDGAAFILVGDLNADPDKGDGRRAGIAAVLTHDRIQDPKPESPGARALGQATDTADWPEKGGPGNLRVDYALPSDNLVVTGSGVFWPLPSDALHRLVAIKGRRKASSDHRLVWVDVTARRPQEE